MYDMANPNSKCGFCGRSNQECQGLIGGPTGISICRMCAKISSAIFTRVEEVQTEAEKMAAELKANGKYIGGGPDCTCGACLFVRLMEANPDIMKASTYMAEEVTTHPGTATVQ